ncbi:MAG: ABC transporter ATP-binding protein [Chloroflexi bacterium]|nr:ABC transporter ATP-binding protein [Chloroflexota bacterium]
MIRKFYPYLGEYKKYLLLIPFLVLLDVLCELSMPLLMARVIDIGIPGKDVAFITRIGIFMIMLALAAIGFGVLNMRYSTRTSMGFGANLRDALFEKVQGFSFNNIDHFSTASLITRLTNDVNNLQITVMMGLRILLRAPMMLVISFVLAYGINPRLSVVLAVAIPLLSIGVFLIMRTAVSRFSIVQEKIDALNNTLQENLIGIRVVKSYVRADHEIQKFTLSNDNLTNAAIRAVSIAILNMPVMMLVMNGATMAIIWMGGRMVYVGTLGAGELISFISYVFQILMSVMMISMVILMSARAEASGKRILEVLETQADIVEPAQPVITEQLQPSELLPLQKTGKVEFRDVSFKYQLTGSGENVLSNISFTALPGQVIGIVGGTGTGKTTLVHLIPRLYDATEGAVLVDDVDVRDYSLESLRAKIGVVLQKNTLFSGTIRENLLWGNPNASEEEMITASKDAQAHDFIMSFPNGYDTQLGQGGVNVSGGQKQRLCIARAILKKPAILILDDSTSAVDTGTEAKIRTAFYNNLANTTVLIIAQRISSVQEADQILVLDDGQIAGMGTHEELINNNPIYQEIYSSQQEGAYIHG